MDEGRLDDMPKHTSCLAKPFILFKDALLMSVLWKAESLPEILWQYEASGAQAFIDKRFQGTIFSIWHKKNP